jgi:hypothetical protein
MRRLLITDGTEKHLGTARYHGRRCRQRKSEPLFSSLEVKISAVYKALREKSRAADDAEEEFTDSRADLDEVELSFEDLVRDMDGEAARLDRQEPSLQAQKKIFPEGFGVVIRPEGKSQLAVIPDLKVRAGGFSAKGAMGDYLKKLEETEKSFQEAVRAVEAAELKVATRRGEEREARGALREQLEENHSDIKKLYKSKPALADRFFPRDARASRGGKDLEAQGKLEGKREALVLVLTARKLSLSDEQKKRLAKTENEETLDRWITIALTIKTPEELFIAPT